MTIRPLADRVVIKSVEAEEKTKTGIILTASAQEKPQIAEVVAVGPGGNVDGKEIVMNVKVGDKEHARHPALRNRKYALSPEGRCE